MGASIVTGMRAPVESSPECPVCLERYQRAPDYLPRFLKCGHTFCTSCLDLLMASTVYTYITCPMCRANHTIGSEMWPVNTSFRGVLDLEEAVEVNEDRGRRPPLTRDHRTFTQFRFPVGVNPSRYFVAESMVSLEDAVLVMGEYHSDYCVVVRGDGGHS